MRLETQVEKRMKNLQNVLSITENITGSDKTDTIKELKTKVNKM